MKTIKSILVTILLLGVPVMLLAGGYGYKTKTSINIVDTAVSARSFNTLVAALKAGTILDGLC